MDYILIIKEPTLNFFLVIIVEIAGQWSGPSGFRVMGILVIVPMTYWEPRKCGLYIDTVCNLKPKRDSGDPQRKLKFLSRIHRQLWLTT